MSGRGADDALFQAQASLRQQQADIAELMVRVAEARELTERARAELDSEAEETQKDRADEEAAARTGALGPSRRELQRRIDREETTWAEVMSGRDEHSTAQDYRDEIGRGVTLLLEHEIEQDPELREGLELMARHTEPGSPRVHVPDWPLPAEKQNDGRTPPLDGTHRRSSGPASDHGTW